MGNRMNLTDVELDELAELLSEIEVGGELYFISEKVQIREIHYISIILFVFK